MNWKLPLDLEVAQERGPVWAVMALSILFAVNLAQLTWKIFPAPDFTSLPFPSQQQQQQQLDKMKRLTGKPPPSMVESKIAAVHLFGMVELNKPKPATDIPVDAPVSSLNLKLLGVMLTNIPGESLAVIEHNSQANYYGVEESINGVAILKKVMQEKVIIEVNGRLESLSMPEEGPPAIQEISMIPDAPPLESPAPSSSRRVDSPKTQQLLKQYRDTLKNDPQSLMSLVRASPVTVAGELKGYRIRPGSNPGLFKDFEFRAGDVVTGINGVSLNDPFKALEIVKDLREAKEVCADFLRDGVNQSQCYSIGE